MVVAFDNNVLCLLLHPEADVPNDPVLSEFLTYASTEYLDEISTSKNFSVGPFDQRAAIEAAAALRRAVRDGLGKKLGLTGSWQKIKVDRQIVAIAKVEGVQTIYTTDKDIQALAADSGLEAVHVASLPLPPSKTPLLDTAEDEHGAPDAVGAGEPEPPSSQSGDSASVVRPRRSKR